MGGGDSNDGGRVVATLAVLVGPGGGTDDNGGWQKQ